MMQIIYREPLNLPNNPMILSSLETSFQIINSLINCVDTYYSRSWIHPFWNFTVTKFISTVKNENSKKQIFYLSSWQWTTNYCPGVLGRIHFVVIKTLQTWIQLEHPSSPLIPFEKEKVEMIACCERALITSELQRFGQDNSYRRSLI